MGNTTQNMGAFNTKTDFQSVLAISCLMFDLEHIIRVIVHLIGRQRMRKYREIGCQTKNFALNLPDVTVTTTTDNHHRKLSYENVSTGHIEAYAVSYQVLSHRIFNTKKVVFSTLPQLF